MKKILIGIMVTIIITSMCGITTGAQSDTAIYEIGDVVVIFDSNSSFTSKEQEQLAILIASQATNFNHNQSASYGLVCTLLGHKYGSSETVTSIVHKVNDAAPRCKRESYSITKCTRCDHAETALLGSYFINCCPTD